MQNRHRIETHSHTATVSQCGWLPPEQLVERYIQAGYSGIIITDHLVSTQPIFKGATDWCGKVHRFFSGYRAARDAAAGTGLTVYPAFELSLVKQPGNDFLVFGIDEALLLEVPEIYDLPLSKVAQITEEMGALIIQAHPFRNHKPADPQYLNGLETFNGNPRHDSNNNLAVEYADRYGLLKSSGSDAHREEDVGIGGIVVDEMPASIFELVRMWRGAPAEIELLTPVISYT